MEVSSKQDLLASCVSEKIEKIITLSNGHKVKIQCLNGNDRLVVVDPGKDLALRVSHAINRGLVEPQLSPRELNAFIRDGGDAPQEIFLAVLNLCGELTTEEAEAKIEAEKK